MEQENEEDNLFTKSQEEENISPPLSVKSDVL